MTGLKFRKRSQKKASRCREWRRANALVCERMGVMDKVVARMRHKAEVRPMSLREYRMGLRIAHLEGQNEMLRLMVAKPVVNNTYCHSVEVGTASIETLINNNMDGIDTKR